MNISKDLDALVCSIDTALGRPPFGDPSVALLEALDALVAYLLSNVESTNSSILTRQQGIIVSATETDPIKCNFGISDLKDSSGITTTFPVIACAYPKGVADVLNPNIEVLSKLTIALSITAPITKLPLKEFCVAARRHLPSGSIAMPSCVLLHDHVRCLNDINVVRDFLFGSETLNNAAVLDAAIDQEKKRLSQNKKTVCSPWDLSVVTRRDIKRVLRVLRRNKEYDATRNRKNTLIPCLVCSCTTVAAMLHCLENGEARDLITVVLSDTSRLSEVCKSDSSSSSQVPMMLEGKLISSDYRTPLTFFQENIRSMVLPSFLVGALDQPSCAELYINMCWDCLVRNTVKDRYFLAFTLPSSLAQHLVDRYDEDQGLEYLKRALSVLLATVDAHVEPAASFLAISSLFEVIITHYHSMKSEFAIIVNSKQYDTTSPSRCLFSKLCEILLVAIPTIYTAPIHSSGVSKKQEVNKKKNAQKLSLKSQTDEHAIQVLSDGPAIRTTSDELFFTLSLHYVGMLRVMLEQRVPVFTKESSQALRDMIHLSFSFSGSVYRALFEAKSAHCCAAVNLVSFFVELTPFLIEAEKVECDKKSPPFSPIRATFFRSHPIFKDIGRMLLVNDNNAVTRPCRDLTCVWFYQMLQTGVFSLTEVTSNTSGSKSLISSFNDVSKVSSNILRKKKSVGKLDLKKQCSSADEFPIVSDSLALKKLLSRILRSQPTNRSTIILAQLVVDSLNTLQSAEFPRGILDTIVALGDSNTVSGVAFIIRLFESQGQQWSSFIDHCVDNGIVLRALDVEAFPSDLVNKWQEVLTRMEEIRQTRRFDSDVVKKESANILEVFYKSQKDAKSLLEKVAKERAKLAEINKQKAQKQLLYVKYVKEKHQRREEYELEYKKEMEEKRLTIIKENRRLETARREAVKERRREALEAIKEHHYLCITLKEYLINNLLIPSDKVYPILATLRNRISGIGTDDVHEYLVTGKASVPPDMLARLEEEDDGDWENEVSLGTVQTEVQDTAPKRALVSEKYFIDDIEGDFWTCIKKVNNEFVSGERDSGSPSMPADTEGKGCLATSSADKDHTARISSMSLHYRLSKLLDCFDYRDYDPSLVEQLGGVPSLLKDCLSAICTRQAMEEYGFLDLDDAIFCAAQKGLMNVETGFVSLTPLGAAYHVRFAKHENSFECLKQQKLDELRSKMRTCMSTGNVVGNEGDDEFDFEEEDYM